MKFGSNYASLRIPYGIPLKMIQFRFGEYETDDVQEVDILKSHPDTFLIGGDEDATGTGDGDKKPEQDRKNRNTSKRKHLSGDGQ